ncbi:hypothetical protein JD844_012559 [Phrynosoma platyrhinos]|uniref:HemK methyltransferase family member 1 n=1 Tax=Phrynosoma platyrhinos TaxID=52577 RepID=A0ABQ7TJZ2_PHRPL|nr:hypothetical protein JD844_012559 [Phrynosoma platyrhinos]
MLPSRTMKVFNSSLYRKLLHFFSNCGHFGMISTRSSALNPCHRLLRQYSCYKAGLVTATDLVSYWQNVFETNAIPEARASSEYIVSHVLGAKTFQSLSADTRSAPLSIKQQEQVEHLCAKRLQRATEELVSLVVDEECRKRLLSTSCKEPRLPPENGGLVILEIGCGSGAISLSLLKKLPHLQTSMLNLQDRVHVLHHDIFSSSWKYLLPWGLIDTIISNPPYVFHEDMTHLAAEILSYEDLGALDGGTDGMSIIREILQLASYILKDCGSVFLEVDPRHPDMVKNWLCSHPDLSLVVCATHKDFCGK